MIEDLKSTNGIFFRGKRIRKRRLKNGDVFIIGEHELMYVQDMPIVEEAPDESED